MRLFVAAYLSQENMRAYQQLVDGLIREVPEVLRSVPACTHHLTLAFLGEVADPDVDRYSDLLDTLKNVEAFDYTLAPPAILMGRGRPRLVHTKVIENAEAISQLQAKLVSGVARSDPSIDSRPKPPHVTLARFKKNAKRWQARQVRQMLERTNDSDFPRMDRFFNIHLVRSTLTPSGPSYESLRVVRLCG